MTLILFSSYKLTDCLYKIKNTIGNLTCTIGHCLHLSIHQYILDIVVMYQSILDIACDILEMDNLDMYQ